ncbi:hypothetical protein [Geothrix edaphica]|uniref:Uncharacterized protein n=1 Tax=Geothrix edaphica TaxID=2927976 RepID=A0ABQ5PZE2_9BACT|nr:hypothetical protein [Geothrix edaphica]GLH67663.1 hypothetical protein GETHED_20270 [Geothrix edaphica]
MSNEIPPSLSAYLPGVGHVCQGCGRMIVDAVEVPGEPFRCSDCRPPASAPEEELTRAALEDREPVAQPDGRPTVWRLVAVIAFAVVALAIVFWKW